MNNLIKEKIRNRKLFQELFFSAQKKLTAKFFSLKKNFHCGNCKKCPNSPQQFDEKLPPDCAYRNWQRAILREIDSISQEVFLQYAQIQNQRKNWQCNKCSTCCKLACSEFSPLELAQKAQAGDEYARQFTSVFVLHANQNTPRQIYPEYIEMLEKELKPDEKVYFYYCPHLDENGLCSRYNERPEICRAFPDNPLSLLPVGCGFCGWKDDVEVLAMHLHAVACLCEFYRDRITVGLSQTLDN